MPLFIDGHGLDRFSQKALCDAVKSQRDKHGVKTLEFFYNKDDNRLYCLLDAPSKDSVYAHHHDIGVDCQFVTQVDTIKNDSLDSEKLATIGQMATRLAHDIRNPISVLNNVIHIIDQKYGHSLNSEIKNYLQIMNTAISSINSQINNVLDFVRINPLKKSNTGILSILNESMSSILIPQNIKLSLPDEDVMLYADPYQLQVVFNNLLTNAIQAIGEDAGTIQIKAINKEDKTIITVHDSGPGIPQDVLPRIFDLLFTTKQKGTGLGLFSCKNIIEQHGGTIEASNSGGALFTITLPKETPQK